MLGLQRNRCVAEDFQHGARPAQAFLRAREVLAAAGQVRCGEVGAKGDAIEVAFGSDCARPCQVGLGCRVLAQQRQHLRADHLRHADKGISLGGIEQIDRLVQLRQRCARIVEFKLHDRQGHTQKAGAAGPEPAPVARVEQPVRKLARRYVRARAQVVDNGDVVARHQIDDRLLAGIGDAHRFGEMPARPLQASAQALGIAQHDVGIGALQRVFGAEGPRQVRLESADIGQVVARHAAHGAHDLQLGAQRGQAGDAAPARARAFERQLGRADRTDRGERIAQVQMRPGFEHVMIDILLMVVIGGMGTMYGAVVGATLFVIAQNYLRDLMKLASDAAIGIPLLPALVHPDRWLLWLGILFILSVYRFPTGIVGKLRLRQ